jgi:hypothetical protein
MGLETWAGTASKGLDRHAIEHLADGHAGRVDAGGSARWRLLFR